MTCRISHFQDSRPFQLNPLVSLLVDSHAWWYTNNKNNISQILKVYIINSIAKSYILNIKIRPLVVKFYMSYLQQYTKIIKMLTLKTYFSYIWSKLKRTRSQITSNLYVSNWKSSYDVNDELNPLVSLLVDSYV
jgi:hypothetical protein